MGGIFIATISKVFRVELEDNYPADREATIPQCFVHQPVETKDLRSVVLRDYQGVLPEQTQPRSQLELVGNKLGQKTLGDVAVIQASNEVE